MDATRWEIWDSGALSCRRIAATDRPFLEALHANPRTSPAHRTTADVAASLQADLDHWQQHGIGTWIVSESGRDIGTCALTHRPEFEGLDLAVCLHPDHWGAGRGSALVQGLCALASGMDDGPARIYALVPNDDDRMLRVLDHAGFLGIGQHEEGEDAACLLVREVRAAETAGDLPL